MSTLRFPHFIDDDFGGDTKMLSIKVFESIVTLVGIEIVGTITLDLRNR